MRDTSIHNGYVALKGRVRFRRNARVLICMLLAALLCMSAWQPAFAKVGDAGEKGTIVGTEGTADDPERGITDEVKTGDTEATAKTEVGVFAKQGNAEIGDMVPPSSGGFPFGHQRSAFSLFAGTAYAADANYTDIWAEVKSPQADTYYSWNVYINDVFDAELCPKTLVCEPGTTLPSTKRVQCPGTEAYVRDNAERLLGIIDQLGYVELTWEILLYSGDEQTAYGRTYTTFTDPNDSTDPDMYGPVDGTEKNPDGTPKYPDLVYEEDKNGDGKPDVEITVSGNDIRKDASLVVVPIERMMGASIWDAFQNRAGNKRVECVYQIMLVIRDANGVVTQEKAFIGPVKVHVRYSKDIGLGEGASGDGMTEWQTWNYPTGALFMADPTQPDAIQEKAVELEADHPGYASIKTYQLGYFAFLGGTMGGSSHTVTVNVGAGGTVVGISGTSKNYTVTNGGTLVLQANPNAGYKLSATSTGGAPIAEVSENAVTIGPVTSNGTVSVAFTFVDANDPNDPNHGVQHTVRARVADMCKGMGTVSVGGETPGDTSQKQYVHGSLDAVVTFSPVVGYHVSGVKVNGKSVFASGSSFSFAVVDADKDVEVFFSRGDAPVQQTWTVTITKNPEDAGVVEGATTIPVNEPGKFRIAANRGQTISAVTLDGAKLPKENLIYLGSGEWRATVPYSGAATRTLAVTFKQGEWPPDSSMGPFDPDNPNGSDKPDGPDGPDDPSIGDIVDPSKGPFILNLSLRGSGYAYVVMQSAQGNIEDVVEIGTPETRSSSAAAAVAAVQPRNSFVDATGLLRASALTAEASSSYAARPSDTIGESKQLRMTPGSTAKIVLLPVYGNHISSVLKNGTNAGVGDTHIVSHTSDANRVQTLDATFTPGYVSDEVLNSILANGASGTGSGAGSGTGSISAIQPSGKIGSGLLQTGDTAWMMLGALVVVAAVAATGIVIARRRVKHAGAVSETGSANGNGEAS